MKLPVVVFAVSLALNLALVATFAAKPSLAPPSMRSFFAARASAADEASASTSRPQAQRKTAPARQSDVWAKLHSPDLPTLVARLRAAGFPPPMIRALVDAEVERQFGPRLAEITRELNDTPYWKPDAMQLVGGGTKVFEEINQLYRERSRLLRELLGKDSLAFGGIDPTDAQRRQFGNISPEKIDLVQRISDDYAEMMGQVRAAMQGIALPEDREALALLERERRADLASVLSPEEFAAYEMRTSPITSRLRAAMTIMDASEAEFRAIYDAHAQFKETLYPTSPGAVIWSSATASPLEERRQAYDKINEQLKGVLSESRYSEYVRANDRDYQTLYRLAQQDNLPRETLARAFDVRDTITKSVMEIANDRSMPAEQKLAAVKELAQNAQTQLLSTLGPTTGPAYVENARWLEALQRGAVMTTYPDGSTSTRNVAARVPPGATPKR